MNVQILLWKSFGDPIEDSNLHILKTFCKCMIKIARKVDLNMKKI